MPEYKAAPAFTKAVEGRTVTGIFAVHGNIDEGGDRSWPGTFANALVDGRSRARFVWQHRTDEPPIAVIKSVREVSRNELPPAVLQYAPDATGGAEVAREYLDTPRGSEVLAGIKAGAIDEMSYAYDVTNSKPEEVDGQLIRNIYGVKLYDISDVLWGMNPATVGSKGLPLELEHQAVRATVDQYIDRLKSLRDLRAKEGRVLSGENRKRIESTLEALDGARQALNDLLAATDKPKDDDKGLQFLLLEWQRLEAQINGAYHP